MHLLDAFRHWLGVVTGTVNEPGPEYGFWSGFGGDITILAGLLGAPIVLLRKHNCVVHGCWRIGRHKSGDHIVCRHHLPGGAVTHQDVIDAHHAARGKPS